MKANLSAYLAQRVAAKTPGIAEKPPTGPGWVSSAFLQVRARSLDRSIPAARARAYGDVE